MYIGWAWHLIHHREPRKPTQVSFNMNTTECCTVSILMGEHNTCACRYCTRTTRILDINFIESLATPLTPLANLKVLMAAAAASSAMDGREREEGGEMKGEGGGALDEGNTAGRKMKSLALLCKR